MAWGRQAAEAQGDAAVLDGAGAAAAGEAEGGVGGEEAEAEVDGADVDAGVVGVADGEVVGEAMGVADDAGAGGDEAGGVGHGAGLDADLEASSRTGATLEAGEPHDQLLGASRGDRLADDLAAAGGLGVVDADADAEVVGEAGVGAEPEEEAADAAVAAAPGVGEEARARLDEQAGGERAGAERDDQRPQLLLQPAAIVLRREHEPIVALFRPGHGAALYHEWRRVCRL